MASKRKVAAKSTDKFNSLLERHVRWLVTPSADGICTLSADRWVCHGPRLLRRASGGCTTANRFGENLSQGRLVRLDEVDFTSKYRSTLKLTPAVVTNLQAQKMSLDQSYAFVETSTRRSQQIFSFLRAHKKT